MYAAAYGASARLHVFKEVLYLYGNPPPLRCALSLLLDGFPAQVLNHRSIGARLGSIYSTTCTEVTFNLTFVHMQVGQA